jgi:hypothetical protein
MDPRASQSSCRFAPSSERIRCVPWGFFRGARRSWPTTWRGRRRRACRPLSGGREPAELRRIRTPERDLFFTSSVFDLSTTSERRCAGSSSGDVMRLCDQFRDRRQGARPRKEESATIAVEDYSCTQLARGMRRLAGVGDPPTYGKPARPRGIEAELEKVRVDAGLRRSVLGGRTAKAYEAPTGSARRVEADPHRER